MSSWLSFVTYHPCQDLKIFFFLIYSTRFSFFSLILDVFLQKSSLIFSLLNFSPTMHLPFILYSGIIPNLRIFQAPFKMLLPSRHHSQFISLSQSFLALWFPLYIRLHILFFFHSDSLSTFHLYGVMPQRHEDE